MNPFQDLIPKTKLSPTNPFMDLVPGQSGTESPYQEDPGFFKGIARDVVKPFARLGTNIVNARQIVAGQKQTQPFSGNFLGEVKPVGQEGSFGEKLKDTLGVGLQVASNIPVAKDAGLTYQGLKTAVKSKALLPTLAKSAMPLVKEGVFAGGSYSVGKALEEQQGVGGVAKSGALGALAGGIFAPVVGLGLPLATKGVRNIPKIKSALTPEPSSIMNRVARLTPNEANNFKKMTGESHGAYLERTGNFGTPQEIVENEAKKFTDTLAEKDAVLESLPGLFKSKQLDMVLDDLAERESKIGVPGNESKRVVDLYSKNKVQGLTQGEINEVKRMYERDVKLGYQKEQNTIGIARSTRLDTALREWQNQLAKNAGLKNLPELSKQIQTSKFIVNKLGKQISGKTGNDALGLTDWIILSGGDPTAITGFLLKKGLLNKGFQAGVAKFLSKKTPTGAISAEFGGKSGLPAKIQGRDYRTTIELGGRKPPTTYEPPAQKINRSSSLPEQKLLSAPTSNAQGKPILLPKSIRETNLGLDEVSQTTRKGSLPPKLLPKQSGKSLSKTIPQPKKKGNLLDIIKNTPNKQGGYIQAYKGEKDLTTKILKDLEGKTTVSKQYILDATNRGELKQVERDLIRRVLDESGDTSPLAQEARKYKSAEEFVKAQGKPVYHGTDANFTEFDIKKSGSKGFETKFKDAIYVSPSKDFVKQYGKNTVEGYISPKAKIIDYDKIKYEKGYDQFFEETAKGNYKARPELLDLKEKYAKKNFDVIRYGENEYVVLNPEVIKTKSQLTDIWNKAKSSDTINVSDFAKKVKAELLPLKTKQGTMSGMPRYESISLPDDLRGSVANYEERIYESPIKTSAGGVHFGGNNYEPEGYFGHTRIEDMADNKTRRVIEVQSDLYQKGRLETEFEKGTAESPFKEFSNEKDAVPRNKELSKLQQYNDPTAHFRMVREEIKKAAQDGKTKLQFPTGETAMKIEGLGENTDWASDQLPSNDPFVRGNKLTGENMKVGMEVHQRDLRPWIITDVLGDGKFKAVPKALHDRNLDQVKKGFLTEKEAKESTDSFMESFDISGKVDTNNPIYKFYEKDLGRYLQNKFGAKTIVDNNGVKWMEVPITKAQGKIPVEAFGKAMLSPLFIGAGASALAVGASQYYNKKKNPLLPNLEGIK